MPPIRLSIGEPQHATPELVRSALIGNLDGPRPPTRPRRGSTRCARRWPPGSPADSACRASIPATQVLPVSGTREALFAIRAGRGGHVAPVAGRREPEPVLPDLRRRGAARRRRAGVPQPDGRQRFRSRPGVADAATSGAGRSWSTSARRGTRPGTSSTSTAGGRCSSTPTATASSSPPTSAIRRSIRTKARRRSVRSKPRTRSGRDTLPEPGRLHEPVEALERAGAAVGRDRRRRGAAEAISAVSHISWMRDEPPRAARQHRGVGRRIARARQPGAVPREVRRRGADARGGARHPPSRRQLLSVGRRAGGRRRGVHARAVRAHARDRVAGALSRARRARREPGRRLRPHRAGARNR